ncbi:hypothetical protein [Vogesella sp. LIG4]|uniref:hypothetical protein n=1 Tax=Vogesella sp. LIG4 TaxID=1192162 RepID=UPI000B5AFDCF|nr:hypothetical protein [Vogesella sp. LIG4]
MAVAVDRRRLVDRDFHFHRRRLATGADSHQLVVTAVLGPALFLFHRGQQHLGIQLVVLLRLVDQFVGLVGIDQHRIVGLEDSGDLLLAKRIAVLELVVRNWFFQRIAIFEYFYLGDRLAFLVVVLVLWVFDWVLSMLGAL